MLQMPEIQGAVEMTTTQVGYAAALEELQEILAELENEQIDIDVLAAKVERAAELIQVCRGRIHTAEVRVKEIVAGLETNHVYPEKPHAQADSAASTKA